MAESNSNEPRDAAESNAAGEPEGQEGKSPAKARAAKPKAKAAAKPKAKAAAKPKATAKPKAAAKPRAAKEAAAPEVQAETSAEAVAEAKKQGQAKLDLDSKPAVAKPEAKSSAKATKAAKTQPEASAPDVSVVIPIYNEEGILTASIADLTEKLRRSEKLGGLRFEIILAENGSTDRTVDIARELMQRHPELRMIHADRPDYGYALRQGILSARGEYVVCDEIDLCDVDFYERALYRLREEGYDLVVGSKALERSFDKRPPFRRFATKVINTMLRVAVGFHGTDTHGMKAFRREAILPVVNRCVVNKDMFASELVVRTERDEALRNTEIPVEVIEKRAPSVQLTRRVPHVLKNIATLTWEIRIRNR